MCRHCAREDELARPVVHAYYEHLANKVNRKASDYNVPLGRPVTADDIEVEVHVMCTVTPEMPVEHIVVNLSTLGEIKQ